MMASVHRDKQPMTLVHSCSSLQPGPVRVRNFVKYDKKSKTVVRRKFTLEQPMVHSVYRGSFWAVDRFNKLCLGPNSIQHSVHTHSWATRVFLALLAMAETNAYLIHNHMLKRDGLEPISHHAWKEELAKALIFNPYRTDLA